MRWWSGLPVAERGEHPLAKRVQRFARQLEGRFHLPVERVDERYTSVAAESLLRGTKQESGGFGRRATHPRTVLPWPRCLTPKSSASSSRAS